MTVLTQRVNPAEIRHWIARGTRDENPDRVRHSDAADGPPSRAVKRRAHGCQKNLQTQGLPRQPTL